MFEIKKLKFNFRDKNIINIDNFKFLKNKFYIIVGESGVGKSTFLDLMLDILKPSEGEIKFALPQKSIGYVSQGRDIIPRLTVRENLMLGMEALPGGMGKNRHIDPFIYELFPILEEFLNRRGGDLSGGQQQQLAIARALLGKPKLLLLDEPTEGIQPSIILDIERAVQRIIKETGISVLLVEQHLHFVRQSNFYYAMQRGGIVSSGPTSSLSEAVVQEFLTV